MLDRRLPGYPANRNSLRPVLFLTRQHRTFYNPQVAADTPNTAAGLRYVESPDPDRAIGKTKIMSLKFNPNTARVDIRVRKADKAIGYRIDVKTPTGEVLTEYATLPDTNGSFPAPKVPGTYRCRVVPLDSKGNAGEPTDWNDFGVF